MPAKRKPARKRASTRKPASANFAPNQLDQLRKTIRELWAKFEREMRKRKIEARIMAEARKARVEIESHVKALRDHGRNLARDLKTALADANHRELARKEALAKIGELRAELAAKGLDLRRKTEQLAKLAEESARRAAGIISGEEPHDSGATYQPHAAPAETVHPGGDEADEER